MTKEQYNIICDYLRNCIIGSKFEGNLYAVGGCCRDFILNDNIKDIDLCVTLPNGGIEFAEWMKEKGETTGNVVTYPTYGTAMFKLKEYPEIELEIVHTRKEQYKDKNSRNPETEYGTIEEDAFRRDLTINAIYYDITDRKFIDPTDRGIYDIVHKTICITNENPSVVLEDDGLRILRIIRFATRYNWPIEKKTYDALKEKVDRLMIITQERITDEFNKMIMSDHPVEALEMMKDIGAMRYVMPELTKLYDLKQNEYHFGTAYEHTLKVLEGIREKDLVLRVAAILHDIGKFLTQTIDEKNGKIHFLRHELVSAEVSEEILRKMKYSNDFISKVVFLVKNHMRTKQWGDDCKAMKDKTLRKLQYECKDIDTFINLMTLIHADNMAHATEHCMPNQVEHIKDRTAKMIREGNSMFGYKLPINGNDIMEVKGIKAGREVKECLDYLMKLAFNNPNISKEDCIKHVKGYKLKNELK